MKRKRSVKISKERKELGMVRQFIVKIRMVVAVEVINVKQDEELVTMLEWI